MVIPGRPRGLDAMMAQAAAGRAAGRSDVFSAVTGEIDARASVSQAAEAT
jgi:hypothetical protein